MDSNLLKERFARARGRSSAFWDAYRRACEYAAPSINSFTGAEGSTKSPDVSTSQALRSTNAFISFFIGALTPPNRRWAQLRPTINMVREFATRGGFTSIAQAEGVLFGAYDEITSVFFEALDMSNFYAVEDQFVRSIGIGTGCLLINEIPVGRQHRNSVPFEFINVPIANLSLDTGNNGRIYGVFREMHVRRAEVPHLWFDVDLSGLEKKEEYDLVECCVYDEGEEPWIFCVFDPSSGIQCLSRRLPYNPYVVFRWTTVDGESMGRGPILYAMSDVLALNRLWATYFQWVQVNGLGSILMRSSELADPGAFQNREFQVGSIIPVNDPSNFVPLRSGGDLGVQQFMIAEFVQSIRQQLLDFELPTENIMTAYETRERANRILKLMSGLIGRINMEFITPFFSVCLHLLSKWDVVQIPPGIGDINQFTTKIALHSPMSRTQQMEDVESTRIAMEVLNLIQSPVAMRQVNMERFVRFVWESCGAPTRLLNTNQEIQEQTAEAIRNQAIAAQSQNMELPTQ